MIQNRQGRKTFWQEGLKSLLACHYALIESFGRPKRHIFILSHMRSGSTLLANLLMANPGIRGIGESKAYYRSFWDFHKAMAKVRWFSGMRLRPGRENYLLDKLLRNSQLEERHFPLILKKNVVPIILVREPSRSIASLMKPPAELGGEAAVEYYCQRLKHLETYANLLRGHQRPFALRYAQLTKQSEATLAALSQYLELEVPLKPDYPVTPFTGHSRFGDCSRYIRQGKILATTPFEPPRLPVAALAKATEAFESCCRVLDSECNHIGILTANVEPVQQTEVGGNANE